MTRKTSIQFAYLGKQIARFLCILLGQIMTSIVIQFVRLRRSFHLVRKSSTLQQEGYLLKMILLS